VTPIASRLVVIQVCAQVGSLFNGLVVVSVKVSLPAVKGNTERFQDGVDRWFIELMFFAVDDDVRLPATIDALPIVANEAKHAQPAVNFIVATVR
jgi:hypothetical protein